MKPNPEFFPEKISTHYASKFKAGNCPLKKQVKFSPLEFSQSKASTEERVKRNAYRLDPVGDREAEIENNILKKYEGRLLVLASNECPIHCRFCFRRNIQLQKSNNLPDRLSKVLAKDKTIKEVILSGGEPLMLSDSELKAFVNVIPQNINIRIHSRAPVALPERFTPGLYRLFRQLGPRLVFVAHVNHSNELDNKTAEIFSFIKNCKATVLSQSVLLRGVNDNVKTLVQLFEKLFFQGVLPYYLHQNDRAKGTAHFEVPIKEAKAIYAGLKESLPGYLVPRLVREIRGGKSKKHL